jgi:hypothetical protein
MSATPNFSDETIRQYLSDSRLGRSDIAIRINACAALAHPWEVYQHHDGSLWNGYGWPILENLPIPVAADVLAFWRDVYTNAGEWLTEAGHHLPHRLDPIAGTPMRQGDEFDDNVPIQPRYTAALQLPPIAGLAILQTRRQAHWAYLDALAAQRRSLGDALDWGAPDFDDDAPIEELLAAGADPEDLMGVGILRDDRASAAVSAPQLSPWANPNFAYQPPTAAIALADQGPIAVDLTNPIF